ncbi:MAG: transglycosylase domain-containing protein [Deltaproteobacteria bacterium]|nr:transglycosylase domain-containing protein [Deltaproteobacteria bacterium]
MRKRFKNIVKVFIITFTLLLVLLAGLSAVVYLRVSRDTAARIERGAINNIIFSESPVYYDDGVSVIGVFFDKTHRKYIDYGGIPPIFIKALIAAEDKNFFQHHGFDPKAILRAMIANIKAGKVVQGGSTITQQTAKNIFKRERRSLKAKIKELVQAILLERKYSKEEILEMYVNQFFVTGFGRGLRIASRYFFDKEARDLDLVEAAFIAGSVKGPSRYNPFIKKTPLERERAMRLAKKRKDYVLRNMFNMGMISEDEYLDAREREVPFKQGRITYKLNVVLDYVRDQLESDFFRSVLEEEGISNIATSGIRIYTSIDREIQDGALRSMRSHLPILDVKISGYTQNALRADEQYPGRSFRKSPDGLPFLSRVTHINPDPNNPYMVVSWEDGGGVVDYEGLKTMGRAWTVWKHGQGARFGREKAVEFLRQFQVGDLVAVRTAERESGRNSGKHLELSKIPELEGGIVVLNNGMIKAMVGGFFNRFFNRAVDAKRQLGSIFKTLVFTAALKLKWNNLDPLYNVRDLFPFESTYYFPAPDHEPRAEKVSLAWAGADSENLATVWLLYHLSDRLNMAEFRRVVESVGLNRREGETYEAYVRRIRDHYGVVVNRNSIMEAAFEEAKKILEPDVIFEEDEELMENLRRLHFKINPELIDLNNPEEARISRLDFYRLRQVNAEMMRKVQSVMEDPDQLDPKVLEGFYHILESPGAPPRVVYTTEGKTGEGGSAPWMPIPVRVLRETLGGIDPGAIWIENVLPSKYLELLDNHTNRLFQRMANLRKYDAQLLYRIRDFKTLVNLHFVIQLARDMGITTPLDPVLSFPLGANSISILDAALAYHTIMTGKIYPLGNSLTPDLVPLITRIVDRDGEVIWQYRPRPRRVLPQVVSAQVTEILRLVVTKGTGRRARDAVRIAFDIEGEQVSSPIQSYGKTGTADRLINSSFVGYIPGPKGDTGQLDLGSGYVIASYVGFDDNRPMKGERIAIYGASGALPLWIDTANTIANSSEYKEHLQAADFIFGSSPMSPVGSREMQAVAVSQISGLPLRRQVGTGTESRFRVLSYATITANGSVKLERLFDPD